MLWAVSTTITTKHIHSRHKSTPKMCLLVWQQRRKKNRASCVIPSMRRRVFIGRLTTFAFNIFSSVRVKSSRSHSAGAVDSAGDAGAAGDAAASAAATGATALAVCNRLTDGPAGVAGDGAAIMLLTTITTPPTATSMGVTIDLIDAWLTSAATECCWWWWWWLGVLLELPLALAAVPVHALLTDIGQV